MRRAALVLIALALTACATNPPPNGGGTIDPCSVASIVAKAACAGGASDRCTQAADAYDVLGCQPPFVRPKPADPCKGRAPICERNDDTECWAQTPDGKCTWFPKVEPPPVTPPPVTPPPVTPPPVEPPCPVGEPDLVAVSPTPPLLLQGLVATEISAMGDTTGADPKVTLDRLAARLRAPGRCVISGIEAVFVQRSDGLWEEYHAVYFGSGALIPGGKPMGVHRSDSTAPPPPPSASACPAPVPPPLWTAETLPPGWSGDLVGQPRWTLKCKEHGPRIADCTPVFQDVWNGEACGYCMAVMGPEARNRCTCPMRPDGHPDRVACEISISGGFVLESRNGAQCAIANDNPFQFELSGGNCRLCSKGTPKVCGAWL